MNYQNILNFPEKSFYFIDDFCVGENNIEAFKIIESWPEWKLKNINIYGPPKSGKTFLLKILSEKSKSNIYDAKFFNKNSLDQAIKQNIFILDNIEFVNDEVLIQNLINDFQSKNKNICFTSSIISGSLPFEVRDLVSRLKSFVSVEIFNPDDSTFYKVFLKNLSDKQINLSSREVEYILKKIERSFYSAFRFVKKLDELSFSYKKKINLKIINQTLDVYLN